MSAKKAFRILIAASAIAFFSTFASEARAQDGESRDVISRYIRLDIIEVHGGVTRTTESEIKAGDPILTFMYSYRRTGILGAELRGYSIASRNLRVPQGTPGNWMGRFHVEGERRVRRPAPEWDIWCFYPRLVGEARDHICLMVGDLPQAAILRSEINPYFIGAFPNASADWAVAPVIEESPATPAPHEYRFEYRFEGWTETHATGGFYVDGVRIMPSLQQRADDGSAEYLSFGGHIVLRPLATDPSRAQLTFQQSPTPPPPPVP